MEEREFKARVWDKRCRKRVWDKRCRKMSHDFEMVYFADGSGGIGAAGGCHHDRDDFLLLLGTGLRDKNGREIYEGDVLEFHPPYNPGRATVEYRGLAFMFVGINNRPDIRGGCSLDTITNKYFVEEVGVEVIGNVYENPELVGAPRHG